ncbi:HypotHetical protein MUW33_2132 [Mycobacterium canetti]|uniref:hypothetical protein n=1 Tax=Mycobacterium canetti TaxID=78331 RepID=UPI002D77F216|nr:hypothetical protein [Mycobacterium canetti]WRO42080.1 HypotHetical protein MUW33_2132 [Mycobacterium canetti]
MDSMDSMDPPTDAPWPIEEVYPRDLVLGDVVKIAGNFPWLQITRIVDAGENQPEWEKPLGSRGFLLSPIDEYRPVTMTYDNHNARTVWRRRQES